MADVQEQKLVMEKFISLENLSTGYSTGNRKQTLLTDVNLSVEGGMLIALAGLNGVGKSTLLKTIAGILKPLTGRVRIRGTDIHSSGPQLGSELVSIVLTHRVGGFNLTVRDAVAAGRLPYTNAFHRLAATDHAAVDAALELCRIGAISGIPLHELSDGMFQKTMIARALAQSTPVMLLDEPTAFLDYSSKHELFLLLKDLSVKQGKCILVSTHDLDLARRYCTHILLMNDGSCILRETADALSHPAYKEITGGFGDT